MDGALSLVGGPASAFLSGAVVVVPPAVVVVPPAVLAVGVMSPVVAGAASPADLAEVVAVDVTYLADAGMVTVGVADLADAGTVDVPGMKGGVVRDDSFVASLECNGGVASCDDRVSPAVWCRERTKIRNALECQYVNCVSCDLVGRGCAVPADGCTGSFGTLLSGLPGPVANDMTHWEKLEALGGDSYAYDDGFGSQPSSLYYDDPRDYEEWCDWNVDIEEG